MSEADRILAGTERALRPPPRMSLSEWAERYFYLSPESSAEPGRWRSFPYQRGIMDAITDPAVERIYWRKSARVGATKIMDATIGYFIDQDPCPIMVVQPTVEDAQGFSKEEIAPMLRDCERLAKLVGEQRSRVSESTVLHKSFPGGSLTMVGANSGRGFRRVSRRVVIFDEVDGYPPSAGNEGDQIKLGIRRTEFYWNRKIIAASTPLVAGSSRIEQMFDDGDQRYYYVPCPTCGAMDILVFRQGARGHYMRWPDGEPDNAHFVCSSNGCRIDHSDKQQMLEGGEWRADAEFRGCASFHIWAAYSLSPNATWAQIAGEFLDAKRAGVRKLQTFVNTVLGETWQDRGEAPEWERLYQRRESYRIGTVPDGVRLITAGVDVQKDCLYYEVVGWALSKESWCIEAGVLLGDTASDATWSQLDALLDRSFEGDGASHRIAMMAVDSGYNTQQVYNWARRYPMSRVIAVKGVGGTQRTLIGTPSAVDVTVRGRKLQRGYKVWPVGVDIIKAELYGWLGLAAPVDDEDAPPGYCHFPELDSEYFMQLTAEQLVTVVKKTGFAAREWQIIPGRQNHWLDARVYARAAASVLGIDRVVVNVLADATKRVARKAPANRPPPAAPARATPATGGHRGRDGWVKGGRGRRKRGWIGK